MLDALRSSIPVLELYVEVDSAYRQAVVNQKALLLGPREDRLSHALASAFQRQKRLLLTRLDALRGQFSTQTAEGAIEAREAIDSDAESIFDSVAIDSIQAFRDPLSFEIQETLNSGMNVMLGEMDLGTSFNLPNLAAEQYLATYGADLVTQINQETKDRLSTLLTNSRAAGLSYDRVAGGISTMFDGFSDYRANLVAVTELGNAYEQGRLLVAQDMASAGLSMEKSWLAESGACDICVTNAEQGWTPLSDSFDSGADRAPGHPGCRCGTLYRRRIESGGGVETEQ